MIAERHAALLSYALQMETAHTQLLSHATLSRSGGTLRITILDIFATLLAPDLVRLQRLHPDIMIELTTEPHFVDLERERIDLAIRLARPLRGANGLKRLAVVDFAIYGSAGNMLAQNTGAYQPLLALYPHHGRMDHDFQLADQRWHEDFGSGTIVARVDGYPTLLRLCEEGMGLAMLPCLLGDASDRLQRIDPVRPPMQAGLWAVIRPDVSRTPIMRTVIAFLTDTFRRRAASLRGNPKPSFTLPA